MTTTAKDSLEDATRRRRLAEFVAKCSPAMLSALEGTAGWTNERRT